MNTAQKKCLKWILVILALTVIAITLWINISLWVWRRKPLQPENSPNISSNPSLVDSVIVSSSFDPEQSQTPNPPTSTGVSPQNFRDISASARRSILREMRSDDLPTLFQKFLDAGRIENDPQKQSSIQSLILVNLQNNGMPEEFTKQMRKFVSDDKNSAIERGSIVSVYGSTGTKIGAEFVLWAASTQSNQEVRESAKDLIAYLNCGEDRELMVSMIEPLWRDSNDPKLIRSVAFGMARQGAPSGIQLLLLAASAPNDQDEVRRVAAVEALAEAYHKIAVPPLEAALNAEPLGSRMHAMAFRTLYQIGDASAAKALISWIQTADSSAADLAKKWMINARAETHIAAAEAALSSDVPFRAEENREALRAGLKVYLSTHPK